MLLPCAGIATIALFVGWLLGGPIARSVDQIDQAGQAFCEGNLEARASGGRGYEAAKLAQAFNETVSTLGEENQALTLQLASSTDAQVLLESQLSQQAEALSCSHRELENFVSVAVHDLKAPLRSILSFGEMLIEKDSGLSAKRSGDYLRRIIAAADRIQMLLVDLREYSLVTSSNAELTDVDLNQVFSQVCNQMHSEIEDLAATVTADPLPTIVASPALARLLFSHLIGNALKYAQDEIAPVISVSSDITAEGFRLIFSDNGMGFEAKYAERIFEPFQRLHHQSAYPGTGIGLALCRKVAQSYGGQIFAAPGDGYGAQFVVELDSNMLSVDASGALADNQVAQSCAA